MLLKIRDWEHHFENNRTRELKSLGWVPLPNRQDGDGYTELLDHKDGASHYGAWVAIVQVASRCDPRGTLLRDAKKPHDATSLSRMTRFPKQIVQSAIERLISIGWLEAVETEADTAKEDSIGSQDDAVIPHLPAVAPQDAALNGREGNGIERREKKGTEAASPVRFLEPSVDEVADYCRERGNQVDPKAFVDFYTSKGWKVGNQKMSDWKASVRTWERRDGKDGRGSTATSNREQQRLDDFATAAAGFLQAGGICSSDDSPRRIEANSELDAAPD